MLKPVWITGPGPAGNKPTDLENHTASDSRLRLVLKQVAWRGVRSKAAITTRIFIR